MVASKEISVDKTKLRVDLYEIKDDGALATVNIGLTVEEGDRFQVSGLFSDGSTTEPGKDGKESTAWRFSMSGVTITDTLNKKIHRVAYDSGMNCLCSSSLHYTFLDSGDTIYLNASYASIPDEQRSATVTVPNAGTFTDVPIVR